MFKKKTSLNIRPEPPSVAEITEDINSADSSDVVFARSNNGTTRFDEFLNDYMSLVLKLEYTTVSLVDRILKDG